MLHVYPTNKFISVKEAMYCLTNPYLLAYRPAAIFILKISYKVYCAKYYCTVLKLTALLEYLDLLQEIFIQLLHLTSLATCRRKLNSLTLSWHTHLLIGGTRNSSSQYYVV